MGKLNLNNAVKVKCEQCGIEFYKSKVCYRNFLKGRGHLWCSYCAHQNANSDEAKEKAKKSRAKTNLERYGVENCWQSEMNKEAQSRIDWAVRQEKLKKTCLEKYGVENGGGSKQSIEKIKAAHSLRTKEEVAKSSEKRRQTFLEKYGRINNHFGAKSIHYDGQIFNSNAEILFYKHCKEKNYSISREPRALEYFDEEGIKHYYIPDFEINGVLYEIKGDYMLNEDDIIIDPYNGNKKLEDKTKCMKENNVVLIRSSKLEEFLKSF